MEVRWKLVIQLASNKLLGGKKRAERELACGSCDDMHCPGVLSFPRCMLQNPDGIRGVTHIIIDEVHERDLDTDFLLIVVRDLLLRASTAVTASGPGLRVIIMSATMDAELFSK